MIATMCGRYSLTSPVEAMRQLFAFEERPNLAPRFNIAPTQDAPVVRLSEDGKRHLSLLRWGLVPSWAKELAIGSRMINARSETLAEKPAFRSAFRQRRCLVLVDGFYEWQKLKSGKQPFRILRPDAAPFAFAGLWEAWKDRESGDRIETFTIATTEANEGLKPIHPRMPVVLDEVGAERWLESKAEATSLQALLRPAAEDALIAYRISTRVNKVANEDAEVIKPLPGEKLPATLMRALGGTGEDKGQAQLI